MTILDCTGSAVSARGYINETLFDSILTVNPWVIMNPDEHPHDQTPPSEFPPYLEQSGLFQVSYTSMPVEVTASSSFQPAEVLFTRQGHQIHLPSPVSSTPPTTPDYEQLDTLFATSSVRQLPWSIRSLANNGYRLLHQPGPYPRPNAIHRAHSSPPIRGHVAPCEVRIRNNTPNNSNSHSQPPILQMHSLHSIPPSSHSNAPSWPPPPGSAHVMTSMHPSPPIGPSTDFAVQVPSSHPSHSQSPLSPEPQSDVEQFIRDSFPEGTFDYERKQGWLREIMYSPWKLNNHEEPLQDLLLRFASQKLQAGKNTPVWECTFYVDGRICENSSTERQRQAIEHVRRHIKLEPFACAPLPCPGHPNGCDKRYSSQDVLKKHRTGKVVCDKCGAYVLVGNLPRHLRNNCPQRLSAASSLGQ